jgi:hypothetical protein
VFRGLKLLKTHYSVNGKCYAYGEKGQFANECPNPCNRPPQTAVSTPAPTRGANSVVVAARQNYVHGKVNHVTVEEA